MKANIEKIIADLGENYKEDEEVLKEILEEVSSIASDISNRKADDEKLFPYIKKVTKAVYLTRGAEGIASRNEGSISTSFEDVSKLKEFIPEYKVTDKNKIGNTYMYICEKVQK